jgi:hypothetical protein
VSHQHLANLTFEGGAVLGFELRASHLLGLLLNLMELWENVSFYTFFKLNRALSLQSPGGVKAFG